MDFTEYDVRLAAYALVVDPHGQLLLSWYNGKGRGEPGWTLPGGGVEYDETTIEEVTSQASRSPVVDVALDAWRQSRRLG